MTPTTNSLVVKLCEVMTAVDHVEKKGKNREQNYDFARDVDVSAALRTELASRKVFLCSSITHVDTELYTTKSGGRGAINTVYTNHKFIDGESGETLEFTWASQGMDGQDKGVSKGATSSIKYALLKQFLIPTGDDPDEGTKPKDLPVAPVARQAAPRPLQAPSAPSAPPPAATGGWGHVTPATATNTSRAWFFAKLKEETGLDSKEAYALLEVKSLSEEMPDHSFDAILGFVKVAQQRKLVRPAAAK